VKEDVTHILEAKTSSINEYNNSYINAVNRLQENLITLEEPKGVKDPVEYASNFNANQIMQD
jgi:hypothetical protein